MKIGITCYPTYGGSGVVATELGLELARRGHEIHFISYSQPIRLTGPEPNIHYHEVEVTRYPLFEYPPYDLALATRMAEVSQLYELDLLHVHYAIPHSVSAMLAKQMLAATPPRRHLPFVTTLHGTDITLVGLDRSYLPITRFSIEQSDGVTAISQYLRNRTLNVFDIKNHIEVIPNFVNCDEYLRKPEWLEKRSEYVSNDERLLVHLSNFRPVKRVLGKQDQIREKLAIADVMLMPSELESFGLAALEGMACEVVPIATRSGGVPEVIEHGVTGFMADVGDVETMARYAIDLLSDESALRAMGKRARASAMEKYCSSKIIPLYEDFYRKVLAQPPKSS
jgi:glycosyltransferase involved in cell wall biosynthesis